MNLLKIPLICSVSFLFIACAGPTTPLGAVWDIGLKKKVDYSHFKGLRNGSKLVSQDEVATAPNLEFFPKRQVLHEAFKMKVVLEDPGEKPKMKNFSIYYDGLNVTDSFMIQTDAVQEDKKLTLEISNVRLKSDRYHPVVFVYKNSLGQTLSERYRNPVCMMRDMDKALSVGSFEVSQSLLETIESESINFNVNPALTTGLIAQESGFNPKAVSWAKALGLTQITSIAESDILRRVSDLRRYPEIKKMPVWRVKALILAGKINSENEWRLNQEKSIKGGLVYLEILNEIWSQPSSIEVIKQHYGSPEIAKTALILASYFSGYQKVMSSLKKNGRDWIKRKHFKLTRSYINRIFSYCYHFANV